MSSPSAGIEMLRNRLANLDAEVPASGFEPIDAPENPVHDPDFGFLSDFTPGETRDRTTWSDPQKRQFSTFARELSELTGPRYDAKLNAAAQTLSSWLREGFQPVVFCRYLATARYLGEQLGPLLASKFKDLRIEVVTSEDPDDIRRQRVNDLGKTPRRLLIATDCLSEGINLQEAFSAVLHYDLPWNPNRLEQREGRVDRFGQTVPEVKAYLLFGHDNPVDGIVLGVILNKVREIRRATGITVPFPEDSSSVIDAVAQALLLHPGKCIRARATNQLELNLDEFIEAREAELRITHKIEDAAKRESATRNIFAFHSIKAEEVEKDLREADAAIGDVAAVERFVTRGVRELLGAQMDQTKAGWRIYTANLPAGLKAMLPEETTVDVSFQSPTPRGCLYLGRNHPFVEQLCQHVMARTLEHAAKGAAARASVIRSNAVSIKTTLLLFRCRNVIGEKGGPARIVAEEMIVWGYSGLPSDGRFLDSEAALHLLDTAAPASPMTPQSQRQFLEDELQILPNFRAEFDRVAEARSQHLVEAHERFSRHLRHTAAGKFEVVYPVLPMDVLGIYILLPALT
jgi:hypothetical protein